MCNRPLGEGRVLGIRPLNWTNFRPIKGLMEAGRREGGMTAITEDFELALLVAVCALVA